MPRVYISANSGARIGLAADIKQRLRLLWNNEGHPEDGFAGLTLDCEGENDPVLKQVETTRYPDGTYRLDAVIGKEVSIYRMTSFQHRINNLE
jgi:hypothetical protein